MNSAKETLVQRAAVPAIQQTNKQKWPATDPIILKVSAQEVRGPDKYHSPFSFESEIQKLKISIPLVELVKNEAFKRPILEALEIKAT